MKQRSEIGTVAKAKWRALSRSSRRALDTMIALPIVAVLLTPVFPDMFVSWFGSEPSRQDFWVRGASLVVLLAILLLIYGAWVWRESRRNKPSRLFAEGIEECSVLVLPMGFHSTYSQKSDRTYANTIPEWVIDATEPKKVFLVATPEVRARVDLREIHESLRADGIDAVIVAIDGGKEPGRVVGECIEKLVPIVQAALRRDERCYIDTTGGTVPLSMAMLRLAAEIEHECIYVSANFDPTSRTVINGSQKGHRFYPNAITKAPA